MATGDKIFIADKETLDEVKANTEGILAAVQDIDGKFAGIKRYGVTAIYIIRQKMQTMSLHILKMR